MGIKNIIGNLTVDGNLVVNDELTVNGSKVLTENSSPEQLPGHTHGDITNAGQLETASRIVVTDSNKKITTGTIDPANLVVTTDSRLTDARTPVAHNQASNTITTMTGYSKPASTSTITTTDSLNAAIGKLEKALDGKQISGSYAATDHNHDDLYDPKGTAGALAIFDFSNSTTDTVTITSNLGDSADSRFLQLALTDASDPAVSWTDLGELAEFPVDTDMRALPSAYCRFIYNSTPHLLWRAVPGATYRIYVIKWQDNPEYWMCSGDVHGYNQPWVGPYSFTFTTSITKHNASVLAHADIRTAIPTKTSQLTNNSDFATNASVDTKIANLVNSAPEALNTLGELAIALESHEDAYDALLTTVGSKVDKVSGKSLSTNDFTTAEKEKLAGIATGANAYTLPAAGVSLGGVKSGGDVTIADGVITVSDDSHNHVISNIDGLQTALDGKANSSHGTHVSYGGDGSATTVSRSDHTHSYIPLSGGSLNDSATLKFTTYGTRTVTVSGNSIDADMSADTGTWAGNFATLKHSKGTTPMLGWYGSKDSGLYHIFMGGSYDAPAMKMDASGNFTFKNTPKVGSVDVALTSDLPTFTYDPSTKTLTIS